MPTHRLTRVEQIYRPNGDNGEIIVYAGDLIARTGGEDLVVGGQLELCLSPRPSFIAHFSGPPSRVSPHLGLAHDATVTVPEGSSLAPPLESSLPIQPERGAWVESRIHVSPVDAGDPCAAKRFIVHVSQSLQQPVFRFLAPMSDGSRQGQIAFNLSGWSLVLAPVDHPAGDNDFGALIEATPTTFPVDAVAVDQMAHRLFFLLSLMSSREVGLGPICGLDQQSHVVWASWGPPVLRSDRSFAPWCPGHLVSTALPAIADGYGYLAADKALETVTERAINHLLSADSSEALDLRVPVACSGLELLSWAVLRRHGWVAQDTFRQMTSAGALRLLVAWSGLSANLPESLVALASRRASLGRPDLGGPELLFSVRNAVIHPPKSIDDPEWPSLDELFEAWQLSTWYLQLVLLRVLRYDGKYWSRMRLGRSAMDVEPVPWYDAGGEFGTSRGPTAQEEPA
jgi:hypothetical protein